MLLRVGSRGEDVKAVQEFLGLAADGIFGKGTEQAVRDFQKLNGLGADGLVGKGTWAAMGLNDTDATGQEESDAPDIYSKNKVTKGDLEYVEYFMPEDEYKHGPVNYEYLFLHHTAGWHNPYKCVEYWDRDGGTIATEWVMGGPSVKGNDERYDGELLQCFPEGNYAWHLGKNGSQHMHVHSVGIEICNFGYVVNGKTYAGTQVADSQIVTLKEEFRGHKTWHRYSDKQIEQLEKWMKFIGERDGIDIRAGLPTLIKEKGAAAFEFNEDAYYGKVKGVWTHTNTRKDKFDLFPQQELLDMLVSL